MHTRILFGLLGPLDLDAVNRSIVMKSPINEKVDGRIIITASKDECTSTNDASLGRVFSKYMTWFEYLLIGKYNIFSPIHDINIFCRYSIGEYSKRDVFGRGKSYRYSHTILLISLHNT